MNTQVDIVFNSYEKTFDALKNVDIIFNSYEKTFDVLKNTDALLNNRVTLLENSTTQLTNSFVKIEKLSNNNMLSLSQEPLKLSEQTVDFMHEMTQASSASEAVTLILSKYYNTILLLEERVNVTEQRLDSLTGITTQSVAPHNINLTSNLNIPNPTITYGE